MIDFVSVLLAAALGFVLQRSSMCTVANIERLVVQRRVDGLLGLGVAICWAGVVLLGLAWMRPEAVWLPSEHGLSWLLIGGAVVMGAGSALNGGCFVGSIVRIGSGNLNFLATLVGIGLGLRLMQSVAPPPIVNGQEAVRYVHEGSIAYAVAWASFLAIGAGAAAIGWRSSGYRRLTLRGRWPRVLALSATGLLAGLMFARNPGWTYASAVEALANADRAAVTWSPLVAPIALFGGAMASAWASRRFQLQRMNLGDSLRSLCGGALMGAGAGLIPGGNDILLLWAIPGLTIYGTVAYAAMSVSIAVTIAVGRGLRK
jgi:hypothetical protein